MTIPAPAVTPPVQTSISFPAAPPLPESLDFVCPELANPIPFVWPSTGLGETTLEVAAKTIAFDFKEIDANLAAIAKESDDAYSRTLSNYREAIGDNNEYDSDTRGLLKQKGLAKAKKASEDALANGLKAREETLKKLDESIAHTAGQINGLNAMMPTAAAYLAVQSTMTDANRKAKAEWTATLAGAGYSTLTTMAYRAMITGDMPLASAVCDALHNLKRTGEKLPITPNMLAHRVVGKQHAKLNLLKLELADLRAKIAEKRAALVNKKHTAYGQIASFLRGIEINKARTAAE